MENRNNSAKILSIVALVIAVVGVSIGFAAYSNTLVIKSSATVKPDEGNFDVNFSTSGTTETEGAIVATKTPSTVNDLTATDATINNTGDPTISGLHANFTEPGQSVTYSFYAHNNGKLKAYLKSVSFANVEGNSYRKCTAKNETTQTLVNDACEGITISAKVGDTIFSGSQGTINNHLLDINGFEPVIVTISYNENSAVADGDFDVEFGDITLTYSSAN